MDRRLAKLIGVSLVLTMICQTQMLGQNKVKAPKALDRESQYFLNSGDTLPTPLIPKNPRTEEQAKQLEAKKLYSYGYWLENQRRWNEAFETYEKVLKFDPKSVPVYKRIIQLARITRRLNDAQRYLQEAVSIDPDDYELSFTLGRFMQDGGLIPQAVDAYKKAAQSPRLKSSNQAWTLIHLSLGELQNAASNHSDAAESFEKVLDAIERPVEHGFTDLSNQPRFIRQPETLYRRAGNSFRLAKRFDDAIAAYRRAQESNPRTASVYLGDIAMVYFDQENYDQTLEILDEYIATRPDGSAAYELLAKTLEKTGKGKTVLARVEAAQKNDPFNRKLQYYLGTLYEESGEVAKARELYEAVLERRGDPRVYSALSSLYSKEKAFGDLIVLLGESLERFASNSEVMKNLDQWIRKLSADKTTVKEVIDSASELRENGRKLGLGGNYVVAKIAREGDQIDTAAEYYRHAIKIRNQTSALYRELADMFKDAKRYEDAVKVLTEAVESGPGRTDVRVMTDLAEALEYNGQTKEAIETIDKVIKTNPNEVQGFSTKAWIYLHAGDYQNAIKEYEELKADFAALPAVVRGANYLLSHAYTQLGDMDKAEESLLSILSDDPSDASANNDLGYLWADQGKNLEKALRMIKIALDSDPESGAYLDSMGWVLFKLKRAKEALPYLEKAVQQDPEDGVLGDHLADVLNLLGRTDEARQWWSKALKSLESDETAQRDKDRIEKIQKKLKTSGKDESEGDAKKDKD